jgi:hypothetical protein
MSFFQPRWLRVFLSTLIGFLIASAGSLPAQDHVLSPQDLHKAVLDSAALRDSNLGKVEKLLSSAEDTLEKAGVDYRRVQTAVSFLDDEEVSQLAARAEKAQADFAAGALTREQLTYIVIALATAVIILIILEA